jgi:hypothetical protein
MPKTSIQQRLQRDQQILSGIAKDLQSIPSLGLGGTLYTPGSLAALVQSHVTAAGAVTAARQQLAAAIANFQAVDTELGPVVRDLKAWLQGAFGPTSPTLADFGFTPKSTTGR